MADATPDLDAYVDHVVDSAPDLTPAQLDHLRSLLAPEVPHERAS